MRYWVYMNGEVPGSFTAAELAALPGFSNTTLVCPAQGEILEKNWRRAGEFSDIAKAVADRAAAAPPAAPAGPSVAAEAAVGSSGDVDAMIDTASSRLFSHVADLMKELETRREEKALIVSLQRQISALKEELQQSRERADLLEMRLPRIAQLEETARKDAAALESANQQLAQRDAALTEARINAEKTKNELEAARRRLQEATNDLALRNRLVDKLSKELSEKELSLAKSLGVIRRFEEDLDRLRPDPAVAAATAAARAAINAQSAPPTPPPAPRAPAPEPPVPVEPPALAGPAIPPASQPLESAGGEGTLPPSPVPYTLDEPPPTPPYLEPAPPPDSPKAQQALLGLLKKIFPGQPH